MTGLIWLRIGTRDWLLWTREWIYRIHKIRRISLLAEKMLVSQEEPRANRSLVSSCLVHRTCYILETPSMLKLLHCLEVLFKDVLDCYFFRSVMVTWMCMGHLWNDTDGGNTVVRWDKPVAMPLYPRQTLRGPAYKWSSAFTLRGRRLTPQPWHAHRFGYEWVTGANCEDSHVLICASVSSGTNSTTFHLGMLEPVGWRH